MPDFEVQLRLIDAAASSEQRHRLTLLHPLARFHQDRREVAVQAEEAIAVLDHQEQPEPRQPIGVGDASVRDGAHRAALRGRYAQSAARAPQLIPGTEAFHHLAPHRPRKRPSALAEGGPGHEAGRIGENVHQAIEQGAKLSGFPVQGMGSGLGELPRSPQRSTALLLLLS